MKQEKLYIVHSDDNKWYAVSHYAYTDEKKWATKFSSDEADELINNVSVMKLIKEAA